MGTNKVDVSHHLDVVREDIYAVDRLLERSLSSEVPIVKMMGTHLNSMKGKRIRPTILLLICRSHDCTGTSAIKAAASIELLHTATLVHDDVIDDSDLRRGIETLNAVWGENTSVLMGDFIFARAFRILLDIGDPRLTPIFSVAIERMSQAELLQVDGRHQQSVTEDHYFSVIRGKTSSLFGAATEIAGVLCGSDDTTAERYRNFGESIGTAFQITDDLLDYEGETDVTGKPTGGEDLREGRITLPIIYAQRVAEGADRERFSMLLSERDVNGTWLEILSYVQQYGGLEYTMEAAREYMEKARGQLDLIPECEAKVAIEQIMDFILNREH